MEIQKKTFFFKILDVTFFSPKQSFSYFIIVQYEKNLAYRFLEVNISYSSTLASFNHVKIKNLQIKNACKNEFLAYQRCIYSTIWQFHLFSLSITCKYFSLFFRDTFVITVK